MILSLLAFICVTFLPIPLLVAGVLNGGVWPYIAAAYLSIFAFAADELVEGLEDHLHGFAGRFLAVVLPIGLALLHFALLPLALFGVVYAAASTLEAVVIFIGFAMFFGMISTANAHELIHSSNKTSHLLGKWVLISLMFGHHTSAHLQVHHRFVATDKDPNTARLDESVYSFLSRAWIGSFVAGWQAEATRCAIRGHGVISSTNPYMLYFMGSAAIAGFAFVNFGLKGLGVYIALSFLAQIQLLITDYVQHYGLVRRKDNNGYYEPVSKAHSWNADFWFTGMLTLHAPRHSDHHMHPGKTFVELQKLHAYDAPQLPRSMPAMAALAMMPSRWRNLMNPKVAEWYNRIAAEEEEAMWENDIVSASSYQVAAE